MDRVVREEEERFGVTLDKGLAILSEELDRLEAAGAKTISGEFAFKLYDTYGFPLDIVNDVAGKRGIAADEDGYRVCMDPPDLYAPMTRLRRSTVLSSRAR